MGDTITYEKLQDALIESETLGYKRLMVQTGFSIMPVVGKVYDSGYLYTKPQHKPLSFKELLNMDLPDNGELVYVDFDDYIIAIGDILYDDDNKIMTLVSSKAPEFLAGW